MFNDSTDDGRFWVFINHASAILSITGSCVSLITTSITHASLVIPLLFTFLFSFLYVISLRRKISNCTDKNILFRNIREHFLSTNPPDSLAGDWEFTIHKEGEIYAIDRANISIQNGFIEINSERSICKIQKNEEGRKWKWIGFYCNIDFYGVFRGYSIIDHKVSNGAIVFRFHEPSHTMKGGYVKVVDDDINAPFKTTYSEITGRKLND